MAAFLYEREGMDMATLCDLEPKDSFSIQQLSTLLPPPSAPHSGRAWQDS